MLTETQGRGVDVVLNSLSEDKLLASVRCLAQHGRFLEIGKLDFSNNNPLGMAFFLKNTTFHGILLDALFEVDSIDKQEVGCGFDFDRGKHLGSTPIAQRLFSCFLDCLRNLLYSQKEEFKCLQVMGQRLCEKHRCLLVWKTSYSLCWHHE